MKFTKRNDMTNPVEDDNIYNYVFFATRAAKTQRMIAFIENYFAQNLNLEVNVDLSPRSMNIVLENPNKKAATEAFNSFIGMNHDSIHPCPNDISKFVFETDKTSSGRFYLGFKTPQYIEDYWTHLTSLLQNDISKQMTEINYPFNYEKLEGLSLREISEILRFRLPEDFIETCLSEGEKAGLLTSIDYIESMCWRNGFKVKAQHGENNSIHLTIFNTKRGKWTEAKVVIHYLKNEKKPYYKELRVSVYGVSQIEVVETNEKMTKHYDNFVEYVTGTEFFDVLNNALGTLSYPFNCHSYISC